MDELDQHILHKAIGQLSSKKAPEGVWSSIAQELDRTENRTALDRAIGELNQRKAPDAWMDMEQRLDVDASEYHLSRAIAKLPKRSVPEDSFDDIAQRFEHSSGKWRQIQYWASGIAASAILVLGLWWYSGNVKSSERISISYSEEIQPSVATLDVMSTVDSDDEVLLFIRQHCNLLTEKCESPRFKGLLDQYVELDTAKQDLMAQIDANKHGTNLQDKMEAQLVNYLVRIEKEQSKVGKRLIQILMS